MIDPKLRSRPWTRLALAVAALIVSTPVLANEPVRGARLFGKELNWLRSGGVESCNAACSAEKGCTGFNFQEGGFADLEGGVSEEDCQLLTGGLAMKAKGVVSCKAPCDLPKSKPRIILAPDPDVFERKAPGRIARAMCLPESEPIPFSIGDLSPEAGGPNLPQTEYLVRVGRRIVLRGAALDGAILSLHFGAKTDGVWASTGAAETYPIVPITQTDAEIVFSVPEISGVSDGMTRSMVVVVEKFCRTAVAAQALLVAPSPTTRAIARVELNPAPPPSHSPGGQSRLRIYGSGFTGVPGPGGYDGIVGAVFGAGLPGSAANRVFSVANLSASYAEIWIPPGCDQEGDIYLVHPVAGGGVSGTGYGVIGSSSGPIRAACWKEAPRNDMFSLEGRALTGPYAGSVVVSAAGPQTVQVRGRYLRFLKAVRNLGDHPNWSDLTVRYTKTGNIPSAEETMIVELPSYPAGKIASLCLLFDIEGLQETCFTPPGAIVVVN